MADLDLVVQQVVPNNNSRLKVAELLFTDEGHEVIYHDIVAWAVFINGGTELDDDGVLAWSLPVVSNGSTNMHYVVFDSATTEWWTFADSNGKGEESLLEYLSRS